MVSSAPLGVLAIQNSSVKKSGHGIHTSRKRHPRQSQLAEDFRNLIGSTAALSVCLRKVSIRPRPEFV
jgi:hypothetical protein